RASPDERRSAKAVVCPAKPLGVGNARVAVALPPISTARPRRWLALPTTHDETQGDLDRKLISCVALFVPSPPLRAIRRSRKVPVWATRNPWNHAPPRSFAN